MIEVNVYEYTGNSYQFVNSKLMLKQDFIKIKISQIGDNKPEFIYVKSNNKLANKVLNETNNN